MYLFDPATGFRTRDYVIKQYLNVQEMGRACRLVEVESEDVKK